MGTPSVVFAEGAYAYSISREELLDLAAQLASKVDLFQSVWDRDPKAEFFAGTTRDYLYWILGHFQGLSSFEKIVAQKASLLSRPHIQFREMVGPLSDADIMTNHQNLLGDLKGEDYGIRKLDFISFDRINPSHELGKTEIDQGYIPTEKLRLSKEGIIKETHFGDGISELISGKISIQFADNERFWKTYYARESVNHPVILALRYLRIISQDYLRRHGDAYPDFKKLLAPMSLGSKAKIKELVLSASTDESFKKFMRNPSFLNKLNGPIQKSFRSFTNATATFQLMKEMGVLELMGLYPDKIESILGYLLKVKRDEKLVAKMFQTYGYSPEEIYSPIDTVLSDRELIHGAGGEEAFRSLIFQGVMPSESGSVGRGLYGVDIGNLEFAKKWSYKKAKRDDIVVALKLKPDTRIIDISRGPGELLFQSWAKEVKDQQFEGLFDKFAESFGADVLGYSYIDENLKGNRAFVLRNSDVIESKRGVFKNPRPLSDLVQSFEKVRAQWESGSRSEVSEVLLLIKDFLITPLNLIERRYLTSLLSNSLLVELFSHAHRKALLEVLGHQVIRWAVSFLKGPFREEALHLILDFTKKADPNARIYQSFADSIPNGELIFGAEDEEHFRKILFYGHIPTKDNPPIGNGLKCVDINDFVEVQSKNDLLARVNHPVVGLKISPKAKIVDLTQGGGKILFDAWAQEFGPHSIEAFAETFEVDIFVYSIREGRSYLLKNPSVIESRRGVSYTPKRLEDFISDFEKIRDRWNSSGHREISMAWDLLFNFLQTPLLKDEREAVVKLLPDTLVGELLGEANREVVLNKIGPYFKELAPTLINGPHRAKAWDFIVDMIVKSEKNLRPVAAEILTLNSNWAKEIWPQIPSLLRSKEVKRSVLSQALKAQNEWAQDFWDHVPDLLTDPDQNIRFWIVILLEDRLLPPSFWSQLPGILRGGDADALNRMVEVLSKQKKWPREFWNEIPGLLESKRLNLSEKIGESLASQKVWPRSFWEFVPKFLRNPNQNLQLLMLKALKGPDDFPKEVWAELPALMKPKFPKFQREIVLLLRKHPEWSKEVWDEIPQLLRSNDETLRYWTTGTIETMEKWHESFWLQVPDLVQSSPKNLGWGLSTILKNRRDTPQDCSKKIMELNGGFEL